MEGLLILINDVVYTGVAAWGYECVLFYVV